VTVGVEHPWARITVGGVGVLDGDVIDFDDRSLTVATDQPVRGATGRPAILNLGLGADQRTGVLATVRATATTPDGRPCLLIDLDGGDIDDRRRHDRIPFAAKVDILIVSGVASSDARVKSIAVDLTTRGIAVRGERDLPPRADVLLRFPVPPVRGAIVQVRGKVRWCRPDTESGWLIGISFERVSGSTAQSLRNALKAITGED
jgi:hypothetical protein